MVLTLCQFLLDLTRRPARSSPAPLLATEEDTIHDLYFSRETPEIDPALVDRLLWWEGVTPPPREDRMRAEPSAA